MLRPCPLLDNPGRLTQMVKKSGAESTDLTHPEDVDALTVKMRGRCKRLGACFAGNLGSL